MNGLVQLPETARDKVRLMGGAGHRTSGIHDGTKGMANSIKGSAELFIGAAYQLLKSKEISMIETVGVEFSLKSPEPSEPLPEGAIRCEREATTSCGSVTE